MITVTPWGQFGNQIFAHVIAKILAERTGQGYQPAGYWMDKQGRPLRWSAEPFFNQDGSQERNPDTRGPVQEIAAAHWIDLGAVDKDRPIHLCGYFQRYELLKPWKERIRQDWLKIHAPLPQTDDDAVYVHVRRTDYVGGVGNQLMHEHNCRATTIEQYAACLERFGKYERLVLLTDNPEDRFLLEFSRFGPFTITRQKWDQDFLLMASARKLLMSQSTFSWWAGWLGRAERIVCPLFAPSHWHFGSKLYGPPDPGALDFPNLIVDDEPRWEFVS